MTNRKKGKRIAYQTTDESGVAGAVHMVLQSILMDRTVGGSATTQAVTTIPNYIIRDGWGRSADQDVVHARSVYTLPSQSCLRAW